MLRGLDVSHYQGTLAWAEIRPALGLSFAFAKALEAESTFDSKFRTNWAGMRGAGLIRGAYAFARPDADPDDDAAAFVDFVQPTEPTDLLVLDLEASALTGPDTAAWACAWAEAVRRLAPGYAAGLYCGGYMHLPAYAGLRAAFDYWWYPRYPTALQSSWPGSFTPVLPDPNEWGGPPDFWQFSATMPWDGQQFDADVFNGTLNQLKALNRRAVPDTPQPAPRPAPDPTPVEDDMTIIARALDTKEQYAVAEGRAFPMTSADVLHALQTPGRLTIQYDTEDELLAEFPASTASAV